MIYKLKKIVSSPESEIWKSVIVMYIFWFIFSNPGEFDWLGNIGIALVFLLAGWIVIVIGSMLSFNSNKQPSVMIVNDLIDTAKNSVSGLYLLDDKVGVFIQNDDVYEPVANPEKLYFKIKAMQDMMDTTGTIKADEISRKLDLYLNQIKLMSNHDLEDDYFFYKIKKDS